MDITIRGLILILFCAFPFHLNAHDSSDTPLDKGFSWLHDQQLADGSFQTPLDKVAPLAATFESALAFSNSDQLEHIDVSAIDVFLSQQDLQQTEGLVRAIILKLRMGLTIDSEIESLMLHRMLMVALVIGLGLTALSMIQCLLCRGWQLPNIGMHLKVGV